MGTRVEPSESMSEPSARQRRWLIPLLAVGCLTGSAVLAWHHRPLSQTERQLLGRWRDERWIEAEGYTFTADRRFVKEEIVPRWIAGEGTWSAAWGKLELVYDRKSPPWRLNWATAAHVWHLLRPNRCRLDVEFRGESQLEWRVSGAGEHAGPSTGALYRY